MGIKYLQSYLSNHPKLKHEDLFEWNKDNEQKTNSSRERNIIVWDCLGWLRRLYRGHARTSQLLFDFKHLDHECSDLISTFKRFGFELIAFIDGYHCEDKIQEKRRRKLGTLKTINKNIKLIKQMHNETDIKKRKKLLKKFEFVPSSGYATFIEQSLSLHGCKVYRGRNNNNNNINDIDRDIAQYVINNNEKIYGIISTDTDYFGFYNLSKYENVRFITEFHTKTLKEKGKKNIINKQSLHLVYYYSYELWNKLQLNTNEQRLQLICLCGNDFVRKRPRDTILRRCGVDVNPFNKCNSIWAKTVNEAGCIGQSDVVNDNENTGDCDINEENVVEIDNMNRENVSKQISDSINDNGNGSDYDINEENIAEFDNINQENVSKHKSNSINEICNENCEDINAENINITSDKSEIINEGNSDEEMDNINHENVSKQISDSINYNSNGSDYDINEENVADDKIDNINRENVSKQKSDGTNEDINDENIITSDKSERINDENSDEEVVFITMENDIEKDNDIEKIMEKKVDEISIKKQKAVDNLLDIVADAIINNKLDLEVNIPNNVRMFYTTNNNLENNNNNIFYENVNCQWMDLKYSNTFHGGFFFHDIESVGYTIHQKLASIRYALIYKNIELNYIKEYIPFYCSDENTIEVYKFQNINLKQLHFSSMDWNIQLLKKYKGFNNANLYFVYKNTLQILVNKQWIDNVQAIALELQFEIRFGKLKKMFLKSGWPFYEKYVTFKKNGIPRIKDLTIQCLYWELSKLICLNPQNIVPNISRLFDGPLFHYFCYEQSIGDENNVIKELKVNLNECQNEYNRNRKYKSQPMSDNNRKRYHKDIGNNNNRNYNNKKPKYFNNRNDNRNNNRYYEQKRHMPQQYNNYNNQYQYQQQFHGQYNDNSNYSNNNNQFYGNNRYNNYNYQYQQRLQQPQQQQQQMQNNHMYSQNDRFYNRYNHSQ